MHLPLSSLPSSLAVGASCVEAPELTAIIGHMDVIMSAVKWKTTGGRPRRRTTYRALMHFIFNTEPMNRKDPYFDTLKKSYDFIKDSLGTKPNNSKERWLD